MRHHDHSRHPEIDQGVGVLWVGQEVKEDLCGTGYLHLRLSESKSTIVKHSSFNPSNTVQSFIFVGDQFLLILKRRCSFEFTSPIRNSDLQLHVLFIKQWKLTPKENVWFLSPNTLWTFIDDLEILLHFDFLGIKSMFREKERGRKSKEDRTQQNALGKQIHIKVRSSHFFP